MAMFEKCASCDRDDVELEMMPCCHATICWDFCLYEEPTKCPKCGEGIEVISKDPVTKESYVIPTWVKEISK